MNETTPDDRKPNFVPQGRRFEVCQIEGCGDPAAWSDGRAHWCDRHHDASAPDRKTLESTREDTDGKAIQLEKGELP